MDAESEAGQGRLSSNSFSNIQRSNTCCFPFLRVRPVGEAPGSNGTSDAADAAEDEDFYNLEVKKFMSVGLKLEEATKGKSYSFNFQFLIVNYRFCCRF